MTLSNDLLLAFAKVTNDNKESSKDKIIYGTIVSSNGVNYVKLDGSDISTPCTSTTDVVDGERVIVTINNHMATVTGNISSPAARTDDVKDLISIVNDKVDTIALTAETARIDDLVSNNITVNDKLTAHEADISDLASDNITITGKLTTNEADIYDLKADKATIIELNTEKARIDTLETDKLSVEDADIKYADIDFANVGISTIGKMFLDSGIVKDMVIVDGYITGMLNSVSINADDIKAGSIATDRLVVLGSDGLYYKLNISATTITSEQTDKNSLNGTVITARTIDAERIAAGTITANEIASKTITADNILGNTITANEIAAGTITVDNVSSDFGDSLNLYSNESITSVVGDVKDINSTIIQAPTEVSFRFDGRDYIHLTSDGIKLGNNDSNFSLALSNNKLAFLQKVSNVDIETAYMQTDNTGESNFHITDAIIDSSLKIGSFAFIPREIDDSISFKWIGAGV